MPKIFISYRRDDSLHATGRIYDRLANAFGEANVFKDVDSMPLGIDFRKALSDQVSQCDVVLAVIGDDWLSAADAAGSRRLDDEADYVRIEIESALKRDIPVVPLLIGNAPLPKSKDLPESISQLAYRNGTTLREDPHFRADMDRVVKALSHVGAPRTEAGPTPPPSAPQIEIVAAESVGPPSPHISGGWQVNPLYASPGPSKPGIDWFTLARCGLLAAAAVVPSVVALNYESVGIAALMFGCLAPAAAVFAFYPWMFEKLWQQMRIGTPEQYRQHIRTDGRVPFWITYVAVVGALLLFGAIAIDMFWTSVLPEIPPSSSESSDSIGSPTSDDSSIGYRSLIEAMKEGETPATTDDDSPQPDIFTSPDPIPPESLDVSK